MMGKTINFSIQEEALPTFISKEKPHSFFCIWTLENDPEHTLKIMQCYPDDFLLEKLGSIEYNNLRKALGTTYTEDGKVMFNGKEIQSSEDRRGSFIKRDITDITKETDLRLQMTVAVKNNE